MFQEQLLKPSLSSSADMTTVETSLCQTQDTAFLDSSCVECQTVFGESTLWQQLHVRPALSKENDEDNQFGLQFVFESKMGQAFTEYQSASTSHGFRIFDNVLLCASVNRVHSIFLLAARTPTSGSGDHSGYSSLKKMYLRQKGVYMYLKEQRQASRPVQLL